MKKILILLLFPVLCIGQGNFFWSHNSGGGYGYLYNRAAANDGRGIAASGWGVPSDAEWTTLLNYVGSDNGGKMKMPGYAYWDSPNTGATNTSHFSVRGAGYRDFNTGNYQYNGQFVEYLTNYTGALNHRIVLGYNNDTATLSSWFNKEGMSIRLIKSSTTLSDGEQGTYTGNDGKIYPTICIGTQEWLAKNLAETKYANGDLIPVETDNSAWAALTTGARCVYNNDEKYK